MEPWQAVTFEEYTKTFIERHPHYSLKEPGGEWRTVHRPLADFAIRNHLAGKYTVAGLAPWYIDFGFWDLDEVVPDYVADLRDDLGLTDNNSIVFNSESPDSYHIYFRPELNNRPPTRYQYENAVQTYAKRKVIEAYPMRRKCARLPLGKNSSTPVSYSHIGLAGKDWQEKLYWMLKLDPYDLQVVKAQQYELPFPIRQEPRTVSGMPFAGGGGWYAQGAELFQNGLQNAGTRNESTAKVLYYLFRQNVSPNLAQAMVWQWVNLHHNGLSKDILKFPESVKKEIQRQTDYIWSNYHATGYLPDGPHINHNGFVCKPDINEILAVTRGSLPRTRFLFEVLKYSYPRRFRTWVSVSRDRLVRWGNERTYNRYLNELDSKGLVKRGTGYKVGVFSKSLKLNWQYKTSADAVLYEGRSVDSFEDAVKLLYKPEDFRDILRASGTERTLSIKTVKAIYDGDLQGDLQCEKVQHI